MGSITVNRRHAGKTWGVHIKYSAAMMLVCLLVFANLVQSEITHCNPGGSDCSCSDRSRSNCYAPGTESSVHVADLEECIFFCDLFASDGGSCSWAIFDGQSGAFKNCFLYGPGKESMTDYLSSCNQIGQPIRRPDDTCIADDGNSILSEVCGSEAFCPGGCKDCDPADKCSSFQETECNMMTSGTDIGGKDSFEQCHASCTEESSSRPFTYFIYGQREESCTCYPAGSRTCTNEVFAHGISIQDIESCKN